MPPKSSAQRSMHWMPPNWALDASNMLEASMLEASMLRHRKRWRCALDAIRCLQHLVRSAAWPRAKRKAVRNEWREGEENPTGRTVGGTGGGFVAHVVRMKRGFVAHVLCYKSSFHSYNNTIVSFVQRYDLDVGAPAPRSSLSKNSRTSRASRSRLDEACQATCC